MIKLTAKLLAGHYGVTAEAIRYHTRGQGGLKCIGAVISVIQYFESKKKKNEIKEFKKYKKILIREVTASTGIKLNKK
tara:strand:- start:65 stop:298 length:234 start_codon:yes stop_codon:yes gene_type:complete